jgi:hypothetical protein
MGCFRGQATAGRLHWTSAVHRKFQEPIMQRFLIGVVLLLAVTSLSATTPAFARGPSGRLPVIASSEFGPGGRARPASTMPPQAVRARAARALRAAGRKREARRALRATTARAAIAGSGYTFYVRTPQSGSCQFAFSGGVVLRDISIAPPIVYALDAPSQYVYWAGFVYDFNSGATTWHSTYREGIATRTTPSPFAGAQAVRVTGGGTQAIGVNVYWWSSTRGWLAGSAWDLPMWVAQASGTVFTGATNNRC